MGAAGVDWRPRTVIARVAVVAEVDGSGVTRLTRLRSAAPVALRATPDGLYLVGAAAGPLAGDDVTLEIHVRPGAILTVRTAAASLAQPGRGTQPSRFVVEATVGTGATLRWLPEPVVIAAHCFHTTATRLVLEEGARLVWREEVILGRSAEQPGRYRSRTTLDIGSRPVLRQQLHIGDACPGWAGPAVLGGAKAVGNLIVVEPGWSEAPPEALVLGPTAAVLPLAGPAAQVTALAADALGLREALEEGSLALAGSTWRTATRSLSSAGPRLPSRAPSRVRPLPHVRGGGVRGGVASRAPRDGE